MSPATGSQEAARQIRALDKEFARLANARDAAGITELFYAEDAKLLPPNAPMMTGKAAIREFWTGFIALGSTDITLESDQIEAAGDLAYCVGRYGHTVNGTRLHGKYVVVFRRQADGNYKAIADVFNADHS